MPRYSATENQYVEGEDITVLASAARTATGQSAAVPSEEFDTVVLELAVTAASGTSPTLNATVETRKAAGTWRSLGAFAQATGVTSERKSFSGCEDEIRGNYTIAGTGPAFTFSVIGFSK